MMADDTISYRWKEAAKDWVQLNWLADMLEECKSATLSEMMQKYVSNGDTSVSKAEMLAKASDEWKTYVKGMVAARKDANLAKVKADWLRMRHSEQMSEEANNRAEMKL
jgi:hypothetical protein